MGGMSMGGMFLDSSMELTLTDEVVGPEPPVENPVLLWQSDKAVVMALVSQLTEEAHSDVHLHVSDILVELVHASSHVNGSDVGEEASIPVAPTLADFLEEPEIVDQLIAVGFPALSTTNICKSSLTAALSIVGALLTRHANVEYAAADDGITVPLIITALLARLDVLYHTLKAPFGEIQNQYMEAKPRLGMQRLKLVGVLVLLVQAKYHVVDQALVQHQLVGLALDLLFQFDLVNMLHSDVESMITTIFESGSVLLQKTLAASLFAPLLEAYAENDRFKTQDKGYTRGYMGHLNRIMNLIAAVWDDSDPMNRSMADFTRTADLLEIFEEQLLWPEMEAFLTHSLPAINERETCTLGGMPAPKNSMDEDSGSSFDYSGFASQELNLQSQFAAMLDASGNSFDQLPDGDIQLMGSDPFETHEEEEESSSSSDEEGGNSLFKNQIDMMNDMHASSIHTPETQEISSSDDSSDDDEFEALRQGAREFPPTTDITPSATTLDESSRAMEAADEAMFSGSSADWANFDQDAASPQ